MGVKADPGELEAIVKMEKSSNTAAVQRPIGMTSYLSRFLDKISGLCEPLRQLRNKTAPGTKDVHVQALHQLKEAVTLLPSSVTMTDRETDPTK